MNQLSIFLILIIFICVVFSCNINTKEPFVLSECKTLRCNQNKYSLTTLKNKFHNKITDATSSHIEKIKNYFANFKQKWL